MGATDAVLNLSIVIIEIEKWPKGVYFLGQISTALRRGTLRPAFDPFLSGNSEVRNLEKQPYLKFFVCRIS